MIIKNSKKNQEEIKQIFKNPFEVEDLRTKFALKKDYKSFRKTYSSKYPEVKTPNTNTFWNKKFKMPIKFSQLDSMTRDKIDTIISFFPSGNTRLLDLGVGQGYIEQRMSEVKVNCKLFGIDISQKAIARARKKFKGEFKVGDVLNIKNYYKSNYFDVIVAIELIEHLSPRKILNFYKVVNSMLRSGGVFIVSTPLNEGLRYMSKNPSSHVREYTESILLAEFKISGFKVIDKRFFFAFKELYMLKKIISKLWRNRWGANNIVVVARKA